MHGADGQASVRHTASFDVSPLKDFVAAEINNFADRARTLRAWAIMPISAAQFGNMLKDSMVLTGTETLDAIMEQFNIEAKVRGSTVGAGYAAMTCWSSHADRFPVKNSSNVDNVACSLAMREDDVIKILDTGAFKAMSSPLQKVAA